MTRCNGRRRIQEGENSDETDAGTDHAPADVWTMSTGVHHARAVGLSTVEECQLPVGLLSANTRPDRRAVKRNHKF